MSLPTGPFHTFTIPGEEITWAGECPWTARYCFGTASGKIVFQVPDEADELESTTKFQVSDLPVNEVAFWKELIGIATSGAVLIYRGPLQERELTRIAGWPGRARGMIATPRGLMLAAMGSEGLFCFDGGDAAGDQGWLEHPSESVRDYHKVIYMGERDGNEILACAGAIRRFGANSARVGEGKPRGQSGSRRLPI